MGRNWRVDTLRGYFLVCMTLGHFPNALAPFTEYTFGYASSPDGFVFLSGLVSTWVYLSLRERCGPAAMLAKIFRRVGTIYLTHMALVVAGLLVAMHANAAAHKATHAVKILVSAALLSNQEGFDRILPMYCIFLACTPFVLKLFTKGRAWCVGAISAALWIAAQFGVGDPKLADPSTPGNLNFLAWQAFFVAGQYFGYRALRATDGPVKKSSILVTVCVSFALLLMLDRHMGLWGMKPILHFSGHPDHNPARFLDAASLAYLIWLVPRSVDLALMKFRFCQFLNFLGQHSLQVFAFSMLLTRFEAHTIGGFSPVLKMIVTGLTITSLALPAWLHQSFRERARHNSAIPTAEAAVLVP